MPNVMAALTNIGGALCSTPQSLVDAQDWNAVQERVYREKIRTVEELQQHIAEEWERLEKRVIDNAAKQWHKRLCACLAANGGHFDHLL